MTGQAKRVKGVYLTMCAVSLCATIFVLMSDTRRYNQVTPGRVSYKKTATTDNFGVKQHNNSVVKPDTSRYVNGLDASEVNHNQGGPKQTVQQENIPVTWVKEALSLLHPKPCECKGISPFLYGFDKREAEQLRERRKVQMAKFNKRIAREACPQLYVDGSVPLSYPSNGLEVEPDRTISIPGLEVTDTQYRTMYEVQLASKMGKFGVTATVPDVELKGVGTYKFRAKSSSLELLNKQLEFVVYTNTVYDFGVYDVVRFLYGTYEAKFPINIRFKPVPILYYVENENSLKEKVTIMTKTFLRYKVVRRLLKSIRKYYPDIRVIVADDSRPIEDLQGENTDHYIMPFGAGYFGGRNVAMSQVTTKYLMYIDDDNVFTKKTKIERMVEVLDKTDIDIVSGLSDLRNGKKPVIEADKIRLLQSKDEGFCMQRTNGWYRRVPGFPECYETGRLVNFFVGRTDKVRAVGFDPRHNRIGHTEFFIDGLGRLKLAVCESIMIDHRRWRPEDYIKFRKPGDDYKDDVRKYKYFRNNLNCWKRIW